MKQRKTPMRMCVGCREMKPKKELLRIVRTQEGIVLDKTSKMSGRGAYICAQDECLDKAVKIKAMERALESTMSEDVIKQLKRELARRGL